MKISTISNGVVLPTNAQEVAPKGGSGRATWETTQIPEMPVPVTHEPVTREVMAPVEPIINGLGLGLRFHLDRDTGIRVIQVVDVESGDVIRQIPPDEIVDFTRQLQSTKGHFVSQRY
jgi:flagellar protein FlaG